MVASQLVSGVCARIPVPASTPRHLLLGLEMDSSSFVPALTVGLSYRYTASLTAVNMQWTPVVFGTISYSPG